MTDPMAYAVTFAPLAPQWILSVYGHNTRFIQSVVRETSRYALRQNDLGMNACRGALQSSNLADLAAIELDFMAGSVRLALDSAGRVAMIAAQTEDEPVDTLPIE